MRTVTAAQTSRPDRTCEDGFTLIEMIVSLAILSIALGVLFASFSRDMDRQALDREQMQARLLAQSLLAERAGGSDLTSGVTRGLSQSGMAWRVTVEPFGTDEDRKAWRFAPARVTARVQWFDGRVRTVSLTTLRPMTGDDAR